MDKDWSARLSMELAKYESEEDKKRISEEREQTRRDEKIMILGSLVPDLVIDNLDKKMHSFIAVLMMADVSGFTELCDKYSKNSIRASSQITEIINIYMGEMVKVVYEYKGDVVNYSGDAILALWHLEGREGSVAAACRACDCAVYIQERIGEYVTQVNTLRVKLTITAGEVNYLMVGDSNKKDFIVLGSGIMDLKKIEKYTGAGQTVVTKALVSTSMKKRYKFEILIPDEVWRLSGRKYSLDVSQFKQEGGMNYLLSLRPTLRNITTKDADFIKLFMMSAVNKAIEITGKVEQMTEMRNVVIIFINIITNPDTETPELLKIIEDCYLTISKVVDRMEGAVNKFSLFDKDLMFLVIFGLRYYKGAVTEKTALKCAKEIKQDLEEYSDDISVSIGVTSGTVYCGVVGHPVRREFTVIGLKVNMAARLMVAYQNMIVCDRETFLHSRIDYKDFILQEPKYLKGISNVGPIYKYLGQDKEDDQLSKTYTNFPLLGREKEINAFEKLILRAFSQRTPDTKNVLVYMGESGQGKTRILEEIRIVSQDRCLCLLVELHQTTYEIPYSGVQEICRVPLGLTENSTIYERESRLYNLLKGEEYDKNFICMLNKVFNVNFIYTNEYLEANYKTREQKLRKLIVLIMKKLTTDKPTLLIIDDAEYMDKISWLLLYDITKMTKMVTVISLGTKAELFSFVHQFLKKKNVKLVSVGQLDQEYLVGLACQILSVDAIPYNLLVKIQKDSECNPGWIEGFLLVCIQTGYLFFKDEKPDVLSLEKLVQAPKYMLERGHNISVNKIIGRETGILVNQTEMEIIKACAIGEEFTEEEFPMKRESRVISAIYAFDPYAKQILKYCAALGDIFSREALLHLTESISESQLCDSIQLFFEKKILGCATKTHSYDQYHTFDMRKRLLNLYIDEQIECVCSIETDPKLSRPKYAYCKFLRFVSRDFKNAINVLLTHAEKKEYHKKIILYLQELDKQCSSCKNQDNRWKKKGMDNVVLGRVSDDSVRVPGQLLISNYEQEVNEKWKERTSITRTLRYSYVNLSDCHCHLIRIKLNDHFIHHGLEGELIEVSVNAMLDNAILYLTFKDVIQASRLIEKAAYSMSKLSKSIKEPYVWKVVAVDSFINMLRGVCLLTSGRVPESIPFFLDSLSNFNIIFPRTKLKMWFKTALESTKMKFVITHRQSKIGTTKFQTSQTIFMETCSSETLTFLSTAYIALREWDKAKLAAVWSLNKALKVGNNFFILSYALGNVLELSSKLHSRHFLDNLREFAEKLACRTAEDASYLELRSVLYLFKSLITHSLSKGEIDEAIEYSHIALSISLPVQEFESKLRIIPRMIILYALQLDMQAAVSKLTEYESVMNSDVDSSSRIWYIALIMFINLYCGIELLTFSEATRFLEKSGKLAVVKDLESELLLTCCMWLYALRKKKWNDIREWAPRIDEKIWNQKCPTFVKLIIFEGLLLQFSRIDTINKHLDLVKKIIHFDQEISEVINEELIWKPKYLHLVAYKYRMENIKSLSNRNLAQSQMLAECQNNNLESFSVKSDREAWMSDISTGHNVQTIDTVMWKANSFNEIVVYNLPIEDRLY